MWLTTRLKSVCTQWDAPATTMILVTPDGRIKIETIVDAVFLDASTHSSIHFCGEKVIK